MKSNKLIIFVSIILSLNSCAQNKIETKITDANGNEVITNNDDVNPNNLEKTIDEFYLNINDSKKLDNLMSFRFYQKIPYNKFKELMQTKSEKFGVFENKKIEKIEFSPDKNAVKYILDIKYEKTETKEILILIKETEKDNYKIYEYDYQKL